MNDLTEEGRFRFNIFSLEVIALYYIKLWVKILFLAFTVDKSIVESQATLVICPASLVYQWQKEIERRCSKNLLKVELYHGPNREKNILK